MKIDISKTDFKALVELAEKCATSIQSKQCSLREFNQARRLKIIIKKLQRNNVIMEEK